MCTTDFHKVLNELGEVINKDRDIRIGSHSWIGRSVYVCKGVKLQHDTIVGAHSVVTRKFEETNIIIAGNPAEVKKKNVYWER